MKITLEQAIYLLKSGGQLGNRDNDIQYDPDDVEWGKPSSFQDKRVRF